MLAWTGNDAYWNCITAQAAWLSDYSCGGDAPDLTDTGFGKPEGSIRSRGNAERLRIRSGKDELGDHPSGGDTSNFIAIKLCKPQGPIRPLGDENRIAVGSGEDELFDLAGRGKESNVHARGHSNAGRP